MTRNRCVRSTWRFGLLGGVVLGAASLANAQSVEEFLERGRTGLELSLRRLSTTASLLYITAHPDDEDNGLLARLSRGEGVRVGTLTLTRGEGGQNEIGSELFGDLGVLRSEELISAHRLDGAEQLFGRSVDFGYSFSVEETFGEWGEDETVGDIVRVIRYFRPDVVVTLFPDGAGGGQHHQASARLASRAFRAAGDPEQFADQVDVGLAPWKPLKLYRALWRPREEEKGRAAAIALGAYDPALGMSYAELGALARNRHRSQGMNAPPVPGPAERYYLLAESLVPAAATGSIFDALRTTLEDHASDSLVREPVAADLRTIAAILDEARAAVSARDDRAVVAAVARGLTLVRAARARAGERTADLLSREEFDWARALERAIFLDVSATVDDESDGLVAPGESVAVSARFVHQAGAEVVLRAIELAAPAGSTIEEVVRPERLAANEVSRAEWRVRIARDAPHSRPYWYPSTARPNRYDVRGSERTSFRPFDAAPLRVVATLAVGGVDVRVERDVRYEWFDPAVGTRRRYGVRVVPPVSLELTPAVAVVRTSAEPRETRIRVRVWADGPIADAEPEHESGGDGDEANRGSPRTASGTVSLEVPRGWECVPDSIPLELSIGSSRFAEFALTAPETAAPGAYACRAVFRVGGRTFREGYRPISHHHVERRHVYRPAAATIRVVDVAVPRGLEVGYITGVGDEVPTAIVQLGAAVRFLGADELARGDLARFDAIVTGIRAYKDRRDLVAHNGRLLEYVAAGGVFIVQYNKYEFHRGSYAPYDARIDRPHDRVTDETAPVRVLEPAHQLVLWPNRIGPADWDGWVQERGLYFWGEWDERYTPLLEIADPFPYNAGAKRGALLAAAYGDGHYVYTGLSLFRQLPAGVPGAYRLLANLISLGRTKEGER